MNDGVIPVTGFNCFHNRRHRAFVIVVRDNVVLSEADVSRWDSSTIQLLAMMTATNCEQCNIVHLYQGLVLAWQFSRGPAQMGWLERIQNQAMRSILGCTKNRSCKAKTSSDFPTVEDKCRCPYVIQNSADIYHPLHNEFRNKKGSRLKR